MNDITLYIKLMDANLFVQSILPHIDLYEYIKILRINKSIHNVLTNVDTLIFMYHKLDKICNEYTNENSTINDFAKFIFFLIKYRNDSNEVHPLINKLVDAKFCPQQNANRMGICIYIDKLIVMSIISNDIKLAKFLCHIAIINLEVNIMKMFSYVLNTGRMNKSRYLSNTLELFQCDKSIITQSYTYILEKCMDAIGVDHFSKLWHIDRNDAYTYYKISSLGIATLLKRDVICKYLIKNLKINIGDYCWSCCPTKHFIQLYKDGFPQKFYEHLSSLLVNINPIFAIKYEKYIDQIREKYHNDKNCLCQNKECFKKYTK